ncbi:MAG TPA: hypothetical protein V6D11_12390 [Waterburya sp.]|jgi:hypothetical protein
MEKPILDFGDNLNWDLLRRATYQGIKSDIHRSGYAPIPEIALLLPSSIALVGCKSDGALPWWWLGCRASVSLRISPSSTSEYTALVEIYRKNCRLDNLTLLRFPEYQPQPYVLALSVPKWISNLSIEVWYYSGIISDQYQQSLDRIESRLNP